MPPVETPSLRPIHGGEAVVVTVWPSHEVFDAWIATPERDALTASEVHRAVDYRPLVRYELGYLNRAGLAAQPDTFPSKETDS